jgi:hypothetical protein
MSVVFAHSERRIRNGSIFMKEKLSNGLVHYLHNRFWNLIRLIVKDLT